MGEMYCLQRLKARGYLHYIAMLKNGGAFANWELQTVLIKPSAHSTIFVAEDEDFVAGDENLLCVVNTYKRFLSLTTIFNIKYARPSFSSLTTEDNIFFASDTNRAVCARLKDVVVGRI